MSPDETALLRYAASGKRFAVEFGVGGSTFTLLDAGVDRVFSVESDPVWIAAILEHADLRPHIASGRLSVHHGDIGPIGNWGRPVDRSRVADWSNYWREPWKAIPKDEVDLVVVDGRFRVACTLNAMLQGNRDMTIAVHDFWNRSKYGVLLKYLNCACRVDSLAILFSKSTVDHRTLEDDLLRYSRQIL